MVWAGDRPDWMGEDEDEAEAEEYAEDASEALARVVNTATICRAVSVCVGFVCLGVVAAAWMRR